jgi:hypothetical protein
MLENQNVHSSAAPSQLLAVASGLVKDANTFTNSAHGRYALVSEAVHCLLMALHVHHATVSQATLDHEHFLTLMELDADGRTILMSAIAFRENTTLLLDRPLLKHRDSEAVIVVLNDVLPRVTSLIGQPK